MNKQEFQEYYKKNKTVVIGVPIIIFILLLDFFVLKPARMRSKAERNAANNSRIVQPANPAAAVKAPAASAEAKRPIKLPDPIRPPAYPKLSELIDKRFDQTKTYPYTSYQRNIFWKDKGEKIAIVPQIEEEKEEIVERPDISYHGFFSLGADKVAILKSADQLILTKVGTMLKSSPFRLSSVFPDHVVITDMSETNRDFEVALSDKSPEEGGQKR
ncbi:MAG: hypothetical protein Kow0029_22540 [Candidatus Rifleibacteriota bacterium]